MKRKAVFVYPSAISLARMSNSSIVLGGSPRLQHGTEHVIGIARGTSLTQSTFIIHPGVNDHLMFAGEAIEEPIPLMKLGPEPVPIIRAQRISLAKLSGTGIFGNNFPNVTIDCGQQLRGRVLLITCRILRRESVHLRH
jgi:hypothetical protein